MASNFEVHHPSLAITDLEPFLRSFYPLPEQLLDCIHLVAWESRPLTKSHRPLPITAFMMASKATLKSRLRSDYPYILEYRTRW